ncbi:MAG TPA: ImmA/IrrE family metallo-endopeptidase [Symbiobacteriaceae bacterium]|jgi:hypothetical protein
MVAAPIIIVSRASRMAQHCLTYLALKPPIDVLAVARACRLPVLELPPGGPGPWVDACLTYHPAADHWAIFYNPACQNARRRRFSIAHELGHYLLHRHLVHEGRPVAHQLHEDEANEFAGALLMPGNEVRVNRLCMAPEDYFEVSSTAWQVRLNRFCRRGY